MIRNIKKSPNTAIIIKYEDLAANPMDVLTNLSIFMDIKFEKIYYAQHVMEMSGWVIQCLMLSRTKF